MDASALFETGETVTCLDPDHVGKFTAGQEYRVIRYLMGQPDPEKVYDRIQVVDDTGAKLIVKASRFSKANGKTGEKATHGREASHGKPPAQLQLFEGAQAE